MTRVSIDDVKILARRSQLELTEQEMQQLQGDLDAILTRVSQLDELDTDGVEPTYQVTSLKNVCRTDDVSHDDVERDQLLALAPEVHDHHVKVPKVL